VRVVSNASPLIWLSQIDRFALLQTLFEVVMITPEVQAETVERAAGYPNAANVRAACAAGWMVGVPPNDTNKVAVLQAQLHAGEAETLVMAYEQRVEAVLVNDRHVRNFATAMGLRVIGTAGILVLAYERGLPVDVTATLDTMRRGGFRLADAVYQAIVQRVRGTPRS
jgi:predicted nucleic acid-binding protein